MVTAVIFDLDGTVLDNEHKWEMVFARVAQLNSLPVNQGRWVHTPGIGVRPNWEKLVGKGELAEKLTSETYSEYAKQDDEVKVTPGVEEMVAEAKDQGWLTALATGTSWNVVEKELEQLNLWLAFDVTTTGEEVIFNKPDPEIYTLTVQKLGVDPESCWVIEDSLAGVKSAVAAGMTVMGLVSDYASAEELKKAGAKEVVDSLAEAVVLLREYGEKERGSN
ncbi:MAG: Phosphorylated carbohydrates phosphatase [Candidatus Amesbacteria bacterium GW2011_GWA2_47_11b]|uniref:Phosphorylated carbohydrates phosphatase n=2 Tax=Candidatus Amesiibacteriota TaxID=1752730 RepID=A0A0G1UW12_9BACT|nr:MAG: Phosphorylated carbohydrates phosphatase [Microgenomates group bacterium GW2011_GWC1_46_20]KKU58394.1 MAG: Phosphorylated carbohydrates phosphatase [Candidatus Amesbacteria bacterium GW2011_GWA2_47_11b]KKU70213.1 MAG: Phosphorylated carbohydrates phosphatase [Candidatus Amesbacteria bacterium GW2011_GWA1_47_20]